MLTDACVWHESHWQQDFTLFFVSSLVHKTICVSDVTIHPSKLFFAAGSLHTNIHCIGWELIKER